MTIPRLGVLAWLGLFWLVSLGEMRVAQGVESEPQKKAHKVIANNYMRYGRAFEIKEIPTILLMTAPDYQWRGLDGQTQSRAAFEKEMRQWFAVATKMMPASSQILNFNWQKNEAVVVVKQKIGFDFSQGEKMRRFRSVTVARDIWKLYPDGWQVRQSVNTQEDVTLDGRKISP